MDTDITPIFDNDDIHETTGPDQGIQTLSPQGAPPSPHSAPPSTNEHHSDCTRLQDVLDPPHQPPEHEYSQQFAPHPAQQVPPWMYAPQYHPGVVDPPPGAPSVAGGAPIWDPFSTIGTTAWVVLGIAFIIGFVIGKLR